MRFVNRYRFADSKRPLTMQRQIGMQQQQAYAPKNVAVYSAAFSGAMAGLTAPTGSALIDPTTADYAPSAAVAAAFAQAVDTAWGNVTVANSYDTDCIKFQSLQYHASHPILQSVAGTALAALTTQANWTVTATAIVAAVQQGDTNLGTQNITPPGVGNANRAEGSGAATTAGQATITVIAAMKLIAKSSGIFQAGFNFSYASLTAADVATMTVKVFTDAVAGTPLTLGNNGSIGFGSNGVAQPGNVAVNNNGVFTANAGAGITIAGASAGYTSDTKVITQGTAAAGAIMEWNNTVGLALPATGAENPFTIGTTCLITLSVTNSVAARATGNINGYMFEL